MRYHSFELAAALLLAVVPMAAQTAGKKAIFPQGVSTAGPYSPGIEVGGQTLYVAGQVGRNAKTNQIPENFEEEVQQCLDNVGTILREAGYGFQDAVAVQVYLTDVDLFQRMNAVYMKYFPEPRPARTTVGVAKLVGPAKIEITVTAWRPAQSPGLKKAPLQK